VHAHAYPYRSRAEIQHHCLRCADCALRGGKGSKERIALAVYFDPARSSAGLAQKPPMRREGTRILLRPKLAQQSCRALDVCEEEGDGAAWKIASHGRRIPRLLGGPVLFQARECDPAGCKSLAPGSASIGDYRVWLAAGRGQLWADESAASNDRVGSAAGPPGSDRLV